MHNQEGADDLLALVEEIVPYFMDHNSEHDAIDLLMEVDKLEKLTQVSSFYKISLPINKISKEYWIISKKQCLSHQIRMN